MPSHPDRVRWSDVAPLKRDNGKPNRIHEYDEDPETGVCVVCGWAKHCHPDEANDHR